MSDSPEDKERQLIITLALVQKALQDVADKTNIHQKIIFGNGDPQNSITWCLRGLTDSVKRIEEQIKELMNAAAVEKIAVITAKAEENKQKSVVIPDENMPWNQVIKKILIKAPWVIAVITCVAMMNKPATDLIMALIKLIGGGK